MSNRKVYIGIRSGLGNQLFQFAFGYATAKRLNSELVLVPTYYLSPVKKIVKRILGQETRSFQLEKIALPKLPVIGEKKIHQLIEQQEVKLITEELYKGASIDDNSSIYLKGYWQNSQLFNEYRDEIRSFLKPNFPLSSYAAQIKNKVLQNSLPAIHVRRGDFLTNKAFGACNKEYYNSAIGLLKEQKGVDNFLIFSNDIQWAKEHLNVGRDSIFYENRGVKNSDIEEMYLMSLSNGLIISNSTFSWWAAWQNEEQVIAPQKWFTSETLENSSHQLKMDNWQYMPNNLLFA